MMRAGTGFTFGRIRVEPGDRFDLGPVPVHLHGTLIRLYGLKPWVKPKKKESEE